MTAPALVMVASGSSDPLVAQVTHQLVQSLQDIRSEMTVRGAFLQQSPPSAHQVIDQLASAGANEVVLVPLQLRCV